MRGWKSSVVEWAQKNVYCLYSAIQKDNKFYGCQFLKMEEVAFFKAWFGVDMKCRSCINDDIDQ